MRSASISSALRQSVSSNSSGAVLLALRWATTLPGSAKSIRTAPKTLSRQQTVDLQSAEKSSVKSAAKSSGIGKSAAKARGKSALKPSVKPEVKLDKDIAEAIFRIQVLEARPDSTFLCLLQPTSRKFSLSRLFAENISTKGSSKECASCALIQASPGKAYPAG